MQENVPTTLVLQKFSFCAFPNVKQFHFPTFLNSKNAVVFPGNVERFYHCTPKTTSLDAIWILRRKPKSLKMKEKFPEEGEEEQKRERKIVKREGDLSADGLWGAKKVSYSRTFCCTVELHPDLINPFLMRKRRSWPLMLDFCSLRIQQRILQIFSFFWEMRRSLFFHGIPPLNDDDDSHPRLGSKVLLELYKWVSREATAQKVVKAGAEHTAKKDFWWNGSCWFETLTTVVQHHRRSGRRSSSRDFAHFKEEGNFFFRRISDASTHSPHPWKKEELRAASFYPRFWTKNLLGYILIFSPQYIQRIDLYFPHYGPNDEKSLGLIGIYETYIKT